MNGIRLPYFFSLFVSLALLISPLPLSAMTEDIFSNMSEHDSSIIMRHKDESYIYLGKELSKIVQLVEDLSILDNDSHSPLAQLRNHINSGCAVAEYDAIVDTARYMQLVVHENYNKLGMKRVQKFTTDIDAFVGQINSGTLTVDAQALELAKAKKEDHQNVTKGKRSPPNTIRVQGLLSVNDQTVQNITAVSLSATDTIIQNSTITSLSATDAIIPNVTVTTVSVTDGTIQNLKATNISVVDETVTGTLSVTDAVVDTYLRFTDTAGGEYVGIQAPGVVPTSYTVSLPSTVPTVNQVLRAGSTTASNLIWITEGGSIAPASSKTIYVTKYGNDTTGNGSFDTPYLTLAKAIEAANLIASSSNPVAIMMSSGVYTEDNSVGPLEITIAGVSIVGASPNSVIIQPNTPANDLLLIDNTTRIANITFSSSSPLATGISLAAGNLSIFTNVHFVNFLVGVNCAGGASQSYGFDLCFFVDNGTALNVNDTRVECNTCTFFGTSSLGGPAANIGLAITGLHANIVLDSGVIGVCATGMNIGGNAIVTVGNVSLRLNAFDIVQSGASYMALTGTSFEITDSSADIDIQISGAGTIAEIVGCEFNGNSLLNVSQGTSITVTGGATVYISGGTMHNYATGIQAGATSDTSSTFVNATSLIIHDCTTDILQQGTTTLNVNASTTSSSKISINDSTNVDLAFFDLDDNNALTVGSFANQDTVLLQAGINNSTHPELRYKSSLYSTEGMGFYNPLASPSSLFIQSPDNADLTSVTTNRAKITGVRLVSDTGSPVGGVTALRGWDINKNASTAELAFKYQNSDLIGQAAVSQYTVMQLDGVNNQLQLPAAGTKIVFDTDTNLYRSAASVLKTDSNFIVGTLTTGRVVITDPSTDQLASSVTTSTELGYLSGVTSSVQTQINSKVAKAGDIMTGTLQLPAGTTALPSLTFTGSTTTGLSAPTANSLSFSANGAEAMKISSAGVVSIDGFTSAGVVHNDASGNLSSSLIVNGDITNATISNAKLATISSSNTSGNIVVRDGSGNFAANMITLSGTTTNATDAATKAYVDAAISTGLSAKTPALVVSTTNVNEVTGGLLTIDGVTLSVNDRVLLVGQTNAVQNGLWLAKTGAWTRPADFSTSTVVGQAYVLILSGAVYEGSSWLCNTPAAIIDTDVIQFAEFSAPSATTGANVGTGAGQVFQSKTGVTLNFRTLLAGTHVNITNNANDITFTTDATNANTASTIVARDGSGNFSAGTVTASLTGAASLNVLKAGDTMTGALIMPAGTILAPSIEFTGSSSGTGFSAPTANTLSFDISGTEQMNISSSGVTIDGLTSTGVVHNSSAGLLSTSLIVNADVSASAGIVDTKLATISTAGKVSNSATTATNLNTASAIVARDGSGNFVAGTITASLTGSASNNVLKAGDTMTGTLQLPAGSTALPSLVFTGSTTTGLSASTGNLSFSTNGVERMAIASGGAISIDAFGTAGVVHNDASGDLSSSLIVNADVAPAAAIIDTKLATISTTGKVANSATTATSANTANTIVLRDTSGNFSANIVSFNDAVIGSLDISNCIASVCVTALSVTDESLTGTLSVNDEVLNGTLHITPFSTAGVLHNNTSGNITSSLVVNADVSASAAIVDTKLATISTAGKVSNSATTATSANTASAIVARDASNNFSAGTITASLSGNATTATTATNFTGSLSGDVTGTQSATVVSSVGGQSASNVAAATVLANAATNVDTASTIVERDASGNFAASIISMTDGVHSGNLILSTEPSTSLAGNILKGSSRFIHDFGTNNTFVGISAGNFTMSGSGNNSAMGKNALTANTTGAYNTAMGSSSLTVNTVGINNTAMGYNTLAANVTGTDNTAIGYNALANITGGTSGCTAVGSGALAANTIGSTNTAVGYQALAANTVGLLNTAVGYWALQANTTGIENTGIGTLALYSNTIGLENTALGYFALEGNTTGNSNTAIGLAALAGNSTGTANIAVGVRALRNNTGSNNNALGYQALFNNTTGTANTAVGYEALQANTIGINNTALGYSALLASTTGTDNTAIGYNALAANATGTSFNTAVGSSALAANTTGTNNVALGYQALKANTVGIHNTALGYDALLVSTTGTDNTAIGYNALAANATGTSFNTAMGSSALTANTTGNDNTAIGYQALVANVTGSSNIALGYQAGQSLVSGSGNIYINADAGAGAESSTTRIGTSQMSCYIQGINTAGVSGDAVVVDSVTGQLGITLSSRRFKHNIEDIGSLSADILKLRPVTFAYNNDAADTQQFGLIAEEVDQHFPAIVVRDEDGLPYTVRYHLLPVLLLNELQKQHATIQEMKTQYVTVEDMNNAISGLQQQIQIFMNQTKNGEVAA